MKTKYYNWIFLLLISFKLSAAVRTVNPNSAGPGQFTSLFSAISASVNGDTIYMSGGSYVSSISPLNKSLVFIGTGHNPNKQSPLVSSIPYIDLGAGSIGSKFIGINFTSSQYIAISGPINVEYINCRLPSSIYFNTSSPVSGISFKGCIINSQFNSPALPSSPLSVSVSASNCVFPLPAGASFCLATPTILLGGSFNNCQFHGVANVPLADKANGLSVINSIFYGVRPFFSTTNTATLVTNCLSFGNTNNAFNFTTNSINLTGVNPQYTAYNVGGFFDPSDNYRLSASSPGKNYGTDGKDIGVYGGTFNFSMGGEPPSVPVIRAMNLQGATTVPAGVPINVNVSSTVKP